MASVEPRSTFDREFGVILETLQEVHARVDAAIANALESLVKRDQPLAQEIIDKDVEINQLRFSVEEACLALMATQQPAATDLRAVIAAMHIATEMERMADHAAGIAKTVILMGDEPLLKPLIDIPRMTYLAREMLNASLESFMQRDSANAMAVAERDDNMDKLYMAIFDELVEIMAIKPGSATRATYLLWCAHNLERIGDRVTNIAERVVFVSTGDMKELNV